MIEGLRALKEIILDKIAISSEGPTLDSLIDPRFGRAAGFLVVDPESMTYEYLDNGASQVMAQGAGIAAAENIVRSGAKVVLTGFVGPKAFRALAVAGVKIGQNLENMTVQEAVEKYREGNVIIASSPNSRGHGR
jgi:predicted Fe-Mo cluster-binding NifX family protein